MKYVRMLLAFALGCGRIGFDVCAGCSSPRDSLDLGNRTSLVQVAAPGSQHMISTLPVPMDVMADDLLVAATYGNDSAVVVTDSQGNTWQTLPQQENGCGNGLQTYIRFWYTRIATSGTITISVTASVAADIGAFVLELAGVDPDVPVDATSGNDAASGSGTQLDAGSLRLTGADLVFAMFADTVQGTAITPGAGFDMIGIDTSYGFMLEDAPGSAGTVTATASMANADDCWVGSSVALRAR